MKEETSLAMGTIVTVKSHAPSPAIAEIKRLEQLFTIFNPSSEVSRINLAAGLSPIIVSPDTFNAIEQAIKVSHLSNGAFDITLGRKGNYRDIILDGKNNSVWLKKNGMKIDLGGIGKGCAVEAARGKLKARGEKKALIDMRSSIAVIGGPWKIGLQDPQKAGQTMGTIILNDGDALSTSGQYEQPGHIVDPRTGKKTGGCLGVTVITADAGLADALTTAIFVMGPEQGMALLKKTNTRGIIIAKSGKMLANGKIL